MLNIYNNHKYPVSSVISIKTHILTGNNKNSFTFLEGL